MHRSNAHACTRLTFLVCFLFFGFYFHKHKFLLKTAFFHSVVFSDETFDSGKGVIE